MAVRSLVGRNGLAVIFALVGLLSGCTNPTEVDTTARDVAIYRTVILDVVDRSDVRLDGSDGLPVLFIEAFEADGIGLEVQVEVVNGFTEQFDIRFIDRLEEAVDNDLPTLPVRPNSLLIGLGPIVLDETIEVRSELYLDTGAIRAYWYTLAGRNDDWSIVGVPEEIESEGFASEL